MKRFFTVTSPTNSLAVSIYAMFMFYGVIFVFWPPPEGPIKGLGTVWSTVLLISSSAAVYATLSSPRRRDPDQSLIIEFWASLTLCTLMFWLEVALWFYRTPTGAVAWNTLGLTVIFVVGFGARAGQVVHDRNALRKYRSQGPPKM